MNREEIKAAFERDTKNHSIEIMNNDGIYRHLKFTNNGSQVYRFDIHTWPGHLCICGDMGTYVFTRIHDMFDFFETSEDLRINPGYWGEKLVSVDAQSKDYKEFSPEEFRDNVKNEYDMFVEAYEGSTPEELDDLWQEISEEVLSYSHDGIDRAYDAAMRFNWKSMDGTETFNMQDFWEYDCKEFTYHYIWILYAIVWGIKQYKDGFDAAMKIQYERA